MADILVVDDEADIRALIADILEDEGHEARMAADADQAMAAIEASPPDLIILDIWLQGSRMDGIEVLTTVKRNMPDIPVVIISGHGNIEIAVAAVKKGAYDFIEKPFTIDQLMVVVGRALEASRLRRENARLRRQDQQAAELIGASAAMSALRAKLDKVARTGSRVLLSGPPGAGKEVAARYIHARSARADGPFVVVNAATIDPDRMEETLFGRMREDGGHEPGLFEKAHGGTLFIDEVADMPMGAQSKILRALVDQTFQRRGGSETVRVDVRVISATNRDLEALIAQGAFREDLYHRLSVVPIEVPPLAARREDIPLLADHFLERLSRAEGLPRRTLSPEAAALLQTQDWPGNVRQLRNMMEQVLILGAGAAEIAPEELPLGAPSADSGAGLSALIISLPLREARDLFERDYLIAQINRFGGNISRTAEFVGMERSALHRKLKSLGVVTTVRGGARVAVAQDDAPSPAREDGDEGEAGAADAGLT
ncbi:sigma-54-dependent transcriptional regulator [Oceanicella actignis]|uniref:nitrogen assimilation response regulator NtrX n=1 Tax=Oceanicella actignis TaxID=1189325 RepID=UPI0011E6F227|nr:sigma-54 dependent transcriptional regulator [Oceanicella actignis]TYO89904.1 two-component system nitrogen regulation response regulator NtrX [Oceanicella actignis]